MTHQEVSKWHQGDKPTNDCNLFKEECNNVIAEQQGNPRCPVQSFELYMDKVIVGSTYFSSNPRRVFTQSLIQSGTTKEFWEKICWHLC